MRSTDAERRLPTRDWRSWSLPVKLAAIMLVPVVFAVTLSATQIRSQVRRANEYERIGAVFDAVDRLEPLVGELHVERQRAVERLTGNGDPRAWERQAAVVDRGLDDLVGLFERTEFDPVPEARFRESREVLDSLPGLRDRVRSGAVDPPAVIDSYTTVSQALLSVDRALNGTVGDRGLSSNATSLQEILVMMEEVRLQQAWGEYGLAEGSLDDAARSGITASRVRLSTKITDALATTPSRWHQRLSGVLGSEAVQRRNDLLNRMVADPDSLGEVTADEWNSASEQVVQEIRSGQQELSTVVRDRVARLSEGASDAAGRDSVILLSALLAAAAVGTVVTRQLLRSLRQLRRSALDAAEHALPIAVENVRTGRGATEVAPVPVDTRDEVGQVARAFDEVNRQALRLAAEQTKLRRGYGDSFVSVSRRSQSLLERQLLLFEELERDEEDPDQLATLFRLDHLATRMRRNNENLMVLSGGDLVRRFQQPTPLGDVLQSALSEIDQYPKVTVRKPPAVALAGHVASDLVRLQAELFDNAANFSAPETSVTVSSARAEDGSITVDVLDEGIGMGDAELVEANTRLSEADENDLATSRRMGLFVVSRLAGRHGIVVRLHGGPDVDGVRASVWIPAEHVVASTELPDALGGSLVPEDATAVSGPGTQEFPAWQASAERGLFDPAPTEQLAVASLDIPQQPRTPVADVEWSWPSEPEPVPGSWFQPADEQYEWPPEQSADTADGAESGDDSHWRSPEELSRMLAQRHAGLHFGSDGGSDAERHDGEYTAAGLPRRTPKDNLAPGAAAGGQRPADQRPGGAPRRDANRLGGRLADFQSGVRRGRHWAPEEKGRQ